MNTLVIYEHFGNFRVTSLENYNAQIMDANKTSTYNKRDGFNTANDVADYLRKYCHADKIIIK